MTSQNERAEMTGRTAKHRIITALCSMFALMLATIGLNAPTATAASDTATTASGGEGSLTITYQYQDAALNNAGISLYRLADWSAKGGYTPTGDFASHTKYPVDWNILNADQQILRDFANTMAGYIAVNQPAAASTLQTDSAGVTTFNQLSDGLYLAVVAPYQGNVLTCQTAAMLVALPDVHQTAAGQRTLSIEPKADCAVPPTDTVSVTKVWKDKNRSKRPENVTMNLLQDGKVCDSIVLNAANGWKHTWAKLETGHEYNVVEASVPGNYNALVDRENSEYTVTNTAKPESAKTGANVALFAGIVVVLAVAGIAISVAVHRKNSAADDDGAGSAGNAAAGTTDGITGAEDNADNAADEPALETVADHDETDRPAEPR